MELSTIEVVGALVGPGEEPRGKVSVIADEVPAMEASRSPKTPPAVDDGVSPPADVGQPELVATLVRGPPNRRIVTRYTAVALGLATALVLLWRPRGAAEGSTTADQTGTIQTAHYGGAGTVIATDEPGSTLTSSNFPDGELGEIVGGESLDWQQWTEADRPDVTSAESPLPDSLPDPQVSAKARRLRDANKAVKNVLVAEDVGALVSQAKVTVRWAASGEVLEATVHSLPKGIERARVEARLRGLQAPAGATGPLSVERTFVLPLPE